MRINWDAFQAWLSQPWVLTLGVLVIAASFVVALLIEAVKAGVAVARSVAGARQRMAVRRALLPPVAAGDGHG